MQYRHIPRIAEREFSIITPGLTGGLSVAESEALIKGATERGITSIWLDADADAQAAAKIRSSAGDVRRVSFFISYRVAALDSLAKRLQEADATSKDFLVCVFSGDEDERLLEKKEVLREARAALNQGKIAGVGFWAPPRASTIVPLIDAWDEWAFFATDCDYVALSDESLGITGAIEYATAADVGFVATNALANGRLDAVPPDVHEIFRNAPVPRAHDEWALRALWERQELVTAVWAPRSAADVERKAVFAEAGRPNSLPSRELAAIRAAAAKLRESR